MVFHKFLFMRKILGILSLTAHEADRLYKLLITLKLGLILIQLLATSDLKKFEIEEGLLGSKNY